MGSSMVAARGANHSSCWVDTETLVGIEAGAKSVAEKTVRNAAESDAAVVNTATKDRYRMADTSAKGVVRSAREDPRKPSSSSTFSALRRSIMNGAMDRV